MAGRRLKAGAKAEVTALQDALAAEDAASYGYGIVGAHVTGTTFSLATADCVLHERARDTLTQLISALGATPQPAAVAYQLPATVNTPVQAASLAVDLELSVVAGYVSLAGVDNRALRTLAATRMQDAAQRAARWGGSPQAFPGLAR
jgi:hypothetical protein